MRLERYFATVTWAATVIGAVAVTSLSGQVSRVEPAYVASIRPSRDDEATGFKITRGRFTARGVTAQLLIAIAYGIQKFQVLGGEGWVDGQRFDVEAKLEEQSAVSGNERTMIQRLLADRFQLRLHEETREAPVYALVVAGGGPKVRAASAQGGVNVGAGILVSSGMPMGLVASLLGTRLGRTVIDRTKLEGRYAVDLRWTPEPGELPSDSGEAAPAPDSSRPSIFTAIQEQLGLKLVATKGPSGFLVIDRIGRPAFE